MLFHRNFRLSGIAAALIIGLLYCPQKTTAAPQHSQLSQRYEHWLDNEVNYLITDRETLIGFRAGLRDLGPIGRAARLVHAA